VKKLALLFLLLALSAAAIPQRPIPPGERDAERAVYQGEQNIPPPMNQPARPSFQQVQHEADRLATLAHDLPDEVGQLAKGTRPKDLDEKLKEIDKLSRRLRSDLRRM